MFTSILHVNWLIGTMFYRQQRIYPLVSWLTGGCEYSSIVIRYVFIITGYPAIGSSYYGFYYLWFQLHVFEFSPCFAVIYRTWKRLSYVSSLYTFHYSYSHLIGKEKSNGTLPDLFVILETGHFLLECRSIPCKAIPRCYNCGSINLIGQ